MFIRFKNMEQKPNLDGIFFTSLRQSPS